VTRRAVGVEVAGTRVRDSPRGGDASTPGGIGDAPTRVLPTTPPRARAPVRVELLPAGRNQDDVTRVLGVHTILPSQLGPRRAQAGVRALLVELLREALRDAGVVRRLVPLQPRRQALAVAWLTGTIDDQVVLPVAVVCDTLGIDASVLAAIVRARVAP